VGRFERLLLVRILSRSSLPAAGYQNRYFLAGGVVLHAYGHLITTDLSRSFPAIYPRQIETVPNNGLSFFVSNLSHQIGIRRADECPLSGHSSVASIPTDLPQKKTENSKGTGEQSGPHRGLSLKQEVVDSLHYCFVGLCFVLDMTLLLCTIGFISQGLQTDNYLYLADGVFSLTGAWIVGEALWLLIK
jgi:hypothetical protein